MRTNVFVIAIALYAASVSAQERNYRLPLPELAKRTAPNPVYQSRQRELLPQDIDEMIPKADLIAVGTVRPIRTYLSADQKDLYTDYELTPSRVLAASRAVQSGRPGPALPIILTRWGGHAVIDGVDVTVEDTDLRNFAPGIRVMLFLKFDAKTGKYELPDDVSGAFLVTNDSLEPLVNHPRYERIRGKTVDAFAGDVAKLRR
jgi:hypothetical protein